MSLQALEYIANPSVLLCISIVQSFKFSSFSKRCMLKVEKTYHIVEREWYMAYVSKFQMVCIRNMIPSY